MTFKQVHFTPCSTTKETLTGRCLLPAISGLLLLQEQVSDHRDVQCHYRNPRGVLRFLRRSGLRPNNRCYSWTQLSKSCHIIGFFLDRYCGRQMFAGALASVAGLQHLIYSASVFLREIYFGCPRKKNYYLLPPSRRTTSNSLNQGRTICSTYSKHGFPWVILSGQKALFIFFLTSDCNKQVANEIIVATEEKKKCTP